MSTSQLQRKAQGGNGAAKRQDPVLQLVRSMETEVAKALPSHVGKDRFARMILTCYRQTPKLIQCNRASQLAAMMEIARLGLEPGREVYPIPYGKEVQVVIDFKGKIRLMMQSGHVKSIQAHEVCRNDTFEFEYGLEPKLRHVPAMGERGPITHFYAVVHTKDGGYVYEVMTKAEVDAVKKNNQVWRDHYVAMGRKTAVHRVSKYIPQSPELLHAASLDGATIHGFDSDGEATLTYDAESTAVDDTPTAANTDDPPPLSDEDAAFERANPQSPGN